jgi:hypothetical protein
MPKKATSPKAAKAESNVLKKSTSAEDAKSAAGSALSQREPGKRKKGK